MVGLIFLQEIVVFLWINEQSNAEIIKPKKNNDLILPMTILLAQDS